MIPEKDRFDEAVRQKLQGAGIPPPEGVFEQVMAEKKDKRRFLYWFWLLLLIPAAVVFTRTNEPSVTPDDNGHEALPVRNEFKQGTKVSAAGQGKSFGASPTSSEPSSEREATLQPNHHEIAAGERVPATGSATPSGSNLHRRNFNSGSRSRSAVSGGTMAYYSGKPAQTSHKTFTGAYGALPSNSEQQPVYVYPAIPLTSDITGVRPQQFLHNPLPGPPQVLKQLSRFSIEFGAALVFPKISYELHSADSMEIRMYDALQSGSYEVNGFSAELTGNFKLNNHWSAGAGLTYLQQKESASFLFNECYYFNIIDSVQYYILFPFTPPILVTEYDTILGAAFAMHEMKHEVTYQSVTLSAYARYTLPVGRFTVEPQAGAASTLFTMVNGTSNLNPNFETHTDNDIAESKLELTMNGAIGISYACNERMAVFIRSGYSFGVRPFAGNERLDVSRNQFSTGLGLRWNFLLRQATQTPPSGSDIVNR